MKIAFVYDAVYPWVKGGAEMRIHELGKRLLDRGHEVHIFGIKWWEGEDTFEYEGIILHGVCKARNLYVNGRRSISEAIIFAAKLFPELRKENFDLIDVSVFPYFSCFTAKAVSVLKKTRLVLTWHEVWDDYWYEYLGKAGFFGWIVEKMTSKLSENNIAVSGWTKDRLEALGVPRERITVISNGIDLKRVSEIEPEGGKVHSDFENKKYDVIFAGRLIKEKNVDLLIKAVALLKADFPEIRCCIVGDGPEKAALVELAKRTGIYRNVEFAGFQEYGALIGKIRASKVLVLPSSREGFGMVVIEAFACGVPVVTVRAKYNAAQGLVENGVDGFAVEPTEGEIAKALHKIIGKNQDYRKISEAALRKAENYDWEKIIKEICLVYEGYMKKPLK
ncbi:MAG: glycosyltransferase family 4 protein [Methanosarcina flavescens]|jgi:glycosyltransferase involved in cell wall biosynthesis|uniref:Glycosyltransferase family 1 protein n=1 Tax=Methanosarcina flavescens TaxID=1715806 RepID=A0A660HQE8_9EURY|nr:glycosyltransferase family 4 protein [Methanosarcina flavescens]AYK14296.1 glycosyltransferase family 1 protein [Methanosarcina flavescens]NLK33194.1 glycosyltransferase family 4 protein [Methanosarcina flavescens]